MEDVDPPSLPECECIRVRGCWITNRCLLHNPMDGLLVEPPVKPTGLIGILDAIHE
jgi:hypothetical protein